VDTQLTFTDKEYIGSPDEELNCQDVADTLETLQTPEIDPAEFELANFWFLS
jgi:hypothetical protein